MKIYKYLAIGCVALGMSVTSCVNDLDVTPDDPNKATELVSADEYYGFLAQCYSGLVLSGINGGSDITVDDGGAGVYTRQLWNLQELCSDEALIGKNWDDAGIDELDFSTWAVDNHWLYEAYSRFTFQIAMCNEFLRSIDNAAGLISDSEIATMKAEVRTLRALSYYHMIDLFGKGPWTTEASSVGVTPPTLSRAELFANVVADLKEAVPQLTPAATQIYGRVSREAGYMLLAKLYLNAEVYTGTAAWAECAAACQEILKTINTLAPDYKYLFCGSNDKYARGGELLWVVPQDENTTQTYGGTTYLGVGAFNADYSAAELNQFGLNMTAWGGPRCRPELVNAFALGDVRALFHAGSFKNNLEDLATWGVDGSGYMCVKFRYTNEDNYYNDETVGDLYLNTTGFNNADFPLFRLADTFLMLAECSLNGVSCDGQTYFDKVRERAGLTPITLTADNLLKERLCELYWEGHRRSDLIRFGKFTGGSYLWSWKGGVLEGQATPAHRNLYAIPSNYVPTIGQNPGY